jgi:hypothetical protein
LWPIEALPDYDVLEIDAEALKALAALLSDKY